MDYNELKLRILTVMARGEGMDSTAVARELSRSAGLTIDIHALRMALMRYYRFGLLKRERAGGTFTYSLSQRGQQRLRWLEQQKH
jgi:DNA-binding transcriptional regulator PaaX